MIDTNSDNFYESTTAIWHEVSAPKTAPDYMSESGSEYWFTDEGCFRLSDHWGYAIASCHWYLSPTFDAFRTDTYDEAVCGFAAWREIVSDENGAVVCMLVDAQEAEKRSHWSSEKLARIMTLESEGAICR